jgi:transcriptional regulator of arginine metabolism
MCARRQQADFPGRRPEGQKTIDNIIHSIVFLYTRKNIRTVMGSAKTFRHGQILRLVTSERIGNQKELRRRLSTQRLRVTQATLSRDLQELKLIKTPEGYRPASGLVEEVAAMPPLARALGEFLLDIRPAENLLVLKTPPSGAQPLAAAVDGAKFSEIAGTIAGDDTVLIITPTKRQRESLQQKIESFVGRPLRSRAS